MLMNIESEKNTTIIDLDYDLFFTIHSCCLFLCCDKTCFAQFGLAKGRISGGSLDFSLKWWNLMNSFHNKLNDWNTRRMYLWIKLDNDAMFQCLGEKKMKTNMSHTGGRIKHIPRRSKSTIFRYFSVQVSTLPSDIPRGHCGRQRPPLSREPPSVWPASLLIDQDAPGRNRTGRCGFREAMPCWDIFNLPEQNLNWIYACYYYSQSLSIKPNICLTFFPALVWGMVGNGGNCWVLLASHLNLLGHC